MRTMSLSETKKLDRFWTKYFFAVYYKTSWPNKKERFQTHVKRLWHNIENFGDFENKIFGYFQFLSSDSSKKRKILHSEDP